MQESASVLHAVVIKIVIFRPAKENVPSLLLYYPIVLCIPEGQSLNSLPAAHCTRDQ